MERISFENYISAIKDNSIRKSMLECSALPVGVGLDREVQIDRTNNVYADFIYKCKCVDTKRECVIFLPGSWERHHDTQFYPHAGYFTEKHNAFCIGLILKDTGKYPLPYPIQDLIRLLEWVKNNHEEYSIDINKVYVVGGYIGGAIAAETAVLSGSSKGNFEGEMPFNIKGAICLGAPYDYKYCIETGINNERFNYFFR